MIGPRLERERLWLGQTVAARPVPDWPGLTEMHGVRGHLSAAEMQYLFHQAGRLPKGGTWLEIGSFMGLSTIVTANGLIGAGNDGARIYCVDTWQGSPADRTLPEVREGRLFATFLANVEQAGVLAMVQPIRLSSWDAHVVFAEGSLDRIFLDGDSSFEGIYADLLTWIPKLHPHGVLFGRLSGSDGSVERALESFSTKRGVSYEVVGAHAGATMFEIRSPAPVTWQRRLR